MSVLLIRRRRCMPTVLTVTASNIGGRDGIETDSLCLQFDRDTVWPEVLDVTSLHGSADVGVLGHKGSHRGRRSV